MSETSPETSRNEQEGLPSDKPRVYSELEIKADSEQATDAVPQPKDVYLTGGGDYEMERVRKAISRAGAESVDKRVSWEDADIATYQEEAEQILQDGNTPVAVELRGAEQVPGVVDIDHHNEKSARPASITQVLERLGLNPTLADRLAAANDAEYFAGMDKVVATKLTQIREKLEAAGIDEAIIEQRLEGSKRWMQYMVDRVRRKDREAQGVTETMEDEAEAAISDAQYGANGLVLVSITADRPSTVTDRLHYTWEDGKEKLIVVCNSDKPEKEVWFYGSGKLAQTVREHFLALKDEQMQDGSRQGNEFHAWGGGSGFGVEGENAFCGVVARNPQEVIDFISSLHAGETS